MMNYVLPMFIGGLTLPVYPRAWPFRTYFIVTYLVKIVNDRSEHNFVCNFHKPPSANQKQQKPSQEPRKFVRWRALKQ